MMCARTISLGAAALALAACGGGGGFPDAPPIDNPPANGTLAFSWEIHDTDGTVIPCERVGALTVVAKDKADAERALSQVRISVRVNYSNPPQHGAAVVATIPFAPRPASVSPRCSG